MDTIQSPSYDIICREINEVGYLFGIVKYVCDIVVKKFMFAILSAEEFL